MSDRLLFPHNTVFAACVIKAIRVAVVMAPILAHPYSPVAFLCFTADFSVYFAPSIGAECA